MRICITALLFALAAPATSACDPTVESAEAWSAGEAGRRIELEGAHRGAPLHAVAALGLLGLGLAARHRRRAARFPVAPAVLALVIGSLYWRWWSVEPGECFGGTPPFQFAWLTWATLIYAVYEGARLGSERLLPEA